MKVAWNRVGRGAATLLLCVGLVACGAKQEDPDAGRDPASEQALSADGSVEQPATPGAAGASEPPESAGTAGAAGATNPVGASNPAGTPNPTTANTQTVPPPTVIPFTPGKAGGSTTGSATSTTGGATSGESVMPKLATGEQAAYDQALSLYHQKRFSEGEKAFSAFIEAHPSGKLLPNALYWRAECLYARGLFADAVFGFKEVISRFGKHPKAADALLKSAMSYARLKDSDNVALHLAILKEDFPNSPALQRARELKLLP